jgi:hypothetical protein
MDPSTKLYARDDIRMDTYLSRETTHASGILAQHEEITSVTTPEDMRLRMTSSMVMRSTAGVTFVALEAGKRSAQPGDRRMAREYRKLADRSLEWLAQEGVL